MKLIKNNILTILCTIAISVQINYRANRAEQQRADNFERDKKDRQEKTDKILKRTATVADKIATVEKGVKSLKK